MRILEARFHPKGGPEYLVVGHLTWRGRKEREPPLVELTSASSSVSTGGPLLSKLDYLVQATSPAPFDRLQVLRSQFWSFVEVVSTMTLGKR
jgi:hypothetical protein